MKKGFILTLAVLILAVVSLVSGYLMWVSFNTSRSLMRRYVDERNYRYSKLISRSMIYNIVKNPKSYSLDSPCDPSLKEAFTSYLKENSFVGYGWADVVENGVCEGETTVTFNFGSWKGWKVTLMKLRASTPVGILYAAVAQKGEEKFGDTFSWAFGREKSQTIPTATEVHSNAIYSPVNIDLGTTWMSQLRVYGPITSKKSLSIKAHNPEFHDEVIADTLETTIGWFGKASFYKDVYTKNLILSPGANLDFKSNLYAENIQGSGWNSKISVNGNLCASSVSLSNSGELEIGGDFSSYNIDISKMGHIDVGKSMKANSIHLSKIYNGVDVGNSIQTCDLDISGGYTSHVKAGSVVARSLYIDNTAKVEVKDVISNDATISNASNKVEIEKIKVERLAANGNNNFACESHLCASSNVSMVNNTSIDLNSMTVLGNFYVDQSKYRVTGESSIVKEYELDNLQNFRINGKTYTGYLTGNLSCWDGNGFEEKVFSPQKPDISSKCLKKGWNRIDQSVLNSIQPCPIDIPCPIQSCIEEAQDKFALIESTNDAFPSSDVYFSRVESMTEDYSKLCSLGSEKPVGVRFPEDSIVEIGGGNPMILEIKSKAGSYDISINYDVPAGECPAYNATIQCGDVTKSFKFNGVLLSEGDLDIGKNSAGFTKAKVIYGRLFLISKGSVSIYSPFRYYFLSSNSNSWPSRIEEAYESLLDSNPSNDENTYVEVVSNDDIGFLWKNWWFGGQNQITGEFVSLDGAVTDGGIWRNRLVLLGGVYAKRGMEVNPRSVTLITDKRLTVEGFYTCNGKIESVDYEPFTVPGSGTTTGFEMILVR